MKSKIYFNLKNGNLFITNSRENPILIGEYSVSPRKQLKGILLQSLIKSKIEKVNETIVELFVKAHPKNIKDPISRSYNAFFTWNMFYYNNLNLKICKLFPPLRKIEIHDMNSNKEIVNLSLNEMKENLKLNLLRVNNPEAWIQGQTEAKQAKILEYCIKEKIENGFDVKRNQRFKFLINEVKIQDELDVLVFKNGKLIELIEVETIDTPKTIILGSIVNLLAFAFSNNIKKSLVIGGEANQYSKYEKFLDKYICPLKDVNCKIETQYIECKKRIRKFDKIKVVYKPIT